MNKKLFASVEGLLYLSGENGLTKGEFVSLLNIDQIELEQILKQIKEEFAKEEHGIELVQTAESYKFATKKESAYIYKKYAQMTFNDNLPKSAIETLAIIAYNQPMTRFQIEEIKGVSPNHSLQILLNRELVKTVGKSEEIGRPNLYGTTDYFLDFLGINTLNELPPLNEFELKESVVKQHDLFNELDDYKEIRKRLLNDVDFVVKQIEIEDDVVVPELNLFEEGEENDENTKNDSE